MHTDENHDEPVIDPTPERRPGEELARTRENAGISLRAMADTLHLPEKQVVALENDDYASLPPPTFVRGYLRSYARVLGLDDDDIIALYEEATASDDPTLRLAGGGEASAQHRGRVLALLALALAVAVSVGAWWWQAHEMEPAAGIAAAEGTSTQSGAVNMTASDEPTGREAARASEPAGENRPEPSDAQAAADADATTNAAPAPADARSTAAGASADGADAAAAGEVTRTAAADTEEVEAGAAEAASAAQSPDTPESSTVAASSSQQADETATAEAEGASATSTSGDSSYSPPAQTASATRARSPEADEGPEELNLRVDGRSWIEVYDARGRELVYTLYTGSEPLRLRGWAPFEIFLGNSPAVAVQFNGASVQKSAFTRSNRTARFVVDDEGARRR